MYPVQMFAKTKVIPNGVALNKVAVCERALLGLQADHFVIGFVGRFEPEKNPLLLITAFAQLVDLYSHARLILVGYGSQEKVLRERVIRLGLTNSVVFIIAQPAAPYYGIFDCFALSSPREGLSMALLEAMGRGLPCVVTCCDQEHPIVKNGHNGIIVSSYDAVSLSRALQQLMCDPAAAQSMGCKAKKTVLERFTVECMARSYRDLFNSCMKKMSV